MEKKRKPIQDEELVYPEYEEPWLNEVADDDKE